MRFTSLALCFILLFGLCFMAGNATVEAQRRTVVRTEILPLVFLVPNLHFERALGGYFSLGLGANISLGGFGAGTSLYIYPGGNAPRGFLLGASVGYHTSTALDYGFSVGYQRISSGGFVLSAGLSYALTAKGFPVAPLFGIGRAF